MLFPSSVFRNSCVESSRGIVPSSQGHHECRKQHTIRRRSDNDNCKAVTCRDNYIENPLSAPLAFLTPTGAQKPWNHFLGPPTRVVFLIKDPEVPGRYRLGCASCTFTIDYGLPCRHIFRVNDGKWDLHDVDLHWSKLLAQGELDDVCRGLDSMDFHISGPTREGLQEDDDVGDYIDDETMSSATLDENSSRHPEPPHLVRADSEVLTYGCLLNMSKELLTLAGENKDCYRVIHQALSPCRAAILSILNTANGTSRDNLDPVHAFPRGRGTNKPTSYRHQIPVSIVSLRHKFQTYLPEQISFKQRSRDQSFQESRRNVVLLADICR